MNKENKPCPFCGSNELYVEDEHPFWAGCDHCGARGPLERHKELAIQKWNSRIQEAPEMPQERPMIINADKYDKFGCPIQGPDKPDFSIDQILSAVEAGIAKGKAQKAGATNPTYYSRWQIEPLDFISVNNLDFLRGNIIKYIMRYDAKGGLEDLKKARVYLDKLIDKVERENG